MANPRGAEAEPEAPPSCFWGACGVLSASLVVAGVTGSCALPPPALAWDSARDIARAC